MARASEPVGQAEALYHSVSVGDVDHDRVWEHALVFQAEPPADSFNRCKYSKRPEDVVSLQTRPEETGVAVLFATSFPREISLQINGQERVFLVYVEDDPSEQNPAHAEVRIRERGKPYGKVKSPLARQDIRTKLALLMRVVRPPSQPVS